MLNLSKILSWLLGSSYNESISLLSQTSASQNLHFPFLHSTGMWSIISVVKLNFHPLVAELYKFSSRNMLASIDILTVYITLNFNIICINSPYLWFPVLHAILAGNKNSTKRKISIPRTATIKRIRLGIH